MKILLVGSGGREHALARALVAGTTHELYCAPGNAGTAALGKNIDLDQTDGAAIAQWARENSVELVVIGPEAPLIAGVADAVRAVGIPVFGPNADAAQLEGSKAFAKNVMAEAGVATADCFPCHTMAEVERALTAFQPPYVVKNDGLAAGKGVVVTEDLALAREHARACLEAEGGAVVIEDYLDGPEISLFCISDGKKVIPLAPAQDYKRAFNGGEGPNTGGMGAYSPLPWLPSGFTEEVVRDVAQPVIDTMAKRGTPFVGLLYCGLAHTAAGIKVIEFNARFGDPETQVVLPRLKTALAEVLLAAATGQLQQVPPLEWSDQAAVGVVIAAEGYPGAVTTGGKISGIAMAEMIENVHVIVAGARENAAGELVSSGGRVLCVCALGDSVEQARGRVYEAVERVSLRRSHHRDDIADGVEGVCF
ncbi:MAG: phosphoribosylamine--glycine ligase [Actinomycetaceae bacterium]|nr:phosphoribosylamine--glycine ligase [Actinomycetaceae bacterium]